MKHRILLTCVALLALIGTGLAPARAGGPLFVNSDGQPFRYDPSRPVQYVIDPGPLGRRSHAQGATLVRQAQQIWQEVPDSHLRLELIGELPRDVTRQNLMSFLNGLRADDPSPILFDSDGTIMDLLLGEGVSELLFGFSLPQGDARTGQLTQSITVLNGYLADQFADPAILGSITHELGHSLGLAHSQVNGDELLDGDPDNDEIAPAMFYRGPNNSGGLHADDRAWFSWLYPGSDLKDRTGAIRGRVLLPDGRSGLQGIMVVARRADDPQITAVGAVSGFQFHGVSAGGSLVDLVEGRPGVTGGSSDPARLGEFLIPGLPPGTYTIELQELEPSPGVPVPAAYLIGGPKFWREGSSPQDSPASSTPVLVNAGATVTGIDIVLNGESLGEPQPAADAEPNELPAAQPVALPAVISGEVEDGRSNTSVPRPLPADQLEQALQDVYRVTIREPTTVTLLLTAEQAGADLDLYLLSQSGVRWITVAQSTLPGTPPEVLQYRLPAGRFYLGVHRAGERGTAYTLKIEATPAPDPEEALRVAVINYVLVGDVGETSATATWETSDASPSIIYYNQPQREVGSSTRRREHSVPLVDLTPATRSQVIAIAAAGKRLAQADQMMAPLTTAAAPAPGDEPRLVAGSQAVSLFGIPDLVEVVVRLSNPGDGDALNVRLQEVTPAPGWFLFSEALLGQRLPDTLAVGKIGAGGAGALVVRLIRARGTADPKVTVHGTYTDAAGTLRQF